MLVALSSVNTNADSTFAVSTEIEFDSSAFLSLGEIHTMFFFWELFEDPESPVPISESEIRTLKIVFNNPVGLEISHYQDIIFENEAVQPIGGVPRSANGFTFECFGTPSTCLPDGDLVIDNDPSLAQTNSTNGDKTIHVDIPLGGIRLNTYGDFVFGEIFLSEYQNGVQLGSTQVIDMVRVTSSVVVPLPPSFWLFIIGVGTIFGSRRLASQAQPVRAIG
jgi:hypothetical protein